MINGKDYSPNSRGFNFVVVKGEDGKLMKIFLNCCLTNLKIVQLSIVQFVKINNLHLNTVIFLGYVEKKISFDTHGSTDNANDTTIFLEEISSKKK